MKTKLASILATSLTVSLLSATIARADGYDPNWRQQHGQNSDHHDDHHNDHHDNNDHRWDGHRHDDINVVIVNRPRPFMPPIIQSTPIVVERQPVIVEQTYPVPVYTAPVVQQTYPAPVYQAPVYQTGTPTIEYQDEPGSFAPDDATLYQAAPAAAPVVTTQRFICSHHDNGLIFGSASGGTAGALIGATTAKNGHKWAAATGGAILGSLLGGITGHLQDSVDTTCVSQAVVYAPLGETVTWTNPSYVTYEVVPLRERMVGGRQCRDYEVHAMVNHGWRRVVGTTCHYPNDDWVIVR